MVFSHPMSSKEKRTPGLVETLLADIEWTGGPVEVADDRDPEGWRAEGLELARLLSCLPKLGFHATVMYRLSRWLKLRGLSPLSFGLQTLNQLVTGAELSHNADIGPGLRILHPQGVYVGPGSKIGYRATFNQQAAVQKNMTEGSAEPRCGNYLELGPGAKIVGRVEVGDRVFIGPNSVAVDDVPDDATVFGVPAKPYDERMP
jgi:serine O-acetyltransferase